MTSKLAAREHVASGRNAAQSAAVLEYVRRWPDSTSRELAHRARYEMSGLDRVAFARRLPDLEKDGLVVKSGARSCELGKRMAVTWRVA
ncbi:MAG TPA: hypothetical protein VKS22_16205 [Candidatus Binataceae bacterium]|nr:hypothetical protein [Candidatus Binataceae bacterium]